MARLSINFFPPTSQSYQNTPEMEFFLSYQDCSKDVDFQNKRLPNSEVARRRNITKVRYFVRIIINGQYVARTKKYFVEWPSFEINIHEKLQIFLFTKPSSIKAEVVMGTFTNTTVDVIDLDVPGELANTITSSGTIFREKKFAKDVSHLVKRETNKIMKQREKELKAKQAQEKRENKAKMKEQAQKQKAEKARSKSPAKEEKKTEAQIRQDKERLEKERQEKIKKEAEEKAAKEVKLKKEEEDKKQIEQKLQEAAENVIKDSPVQGILFYKSEWYGFGPKLPPPSIDKLEKKKEPAYRKVVDVTTIERMYDLNDPRNEYIIQRLHEMKSHQINELLLKDARPHFYEIEALRQRLYLLRLSEPELNELPIPLSQEEIINNRKLIQFLEVRYFRFFF